MNDAMLMVFCIWMFYALWLWAKPEVFGPLLWVIGVATIFMTLLGMFTESARSAQEYRLKDQDHRQTMERKNFDRQTHLAEMDEKRK